MQGSNKRIKLASLLLAVTVLCLALTGCMAQIGEVTINSDGSGTLKAQMGFTKEAFDAMNSMAQENGGGADMSTVHTFVYNGTTYYGEVQTADFDSLGVLNQSISNVPEGQNFGPLGVKQEPDGSFTLVLDATGGTNGLVDVPTMDEAAAQAGKELSQEEYKQLLDSMVVVYTFNFPSPIIQISGDSLGVTVSGNSVTLNILEMAKTTSKDTYYSFTTKAGSQGGTPTETPKPTETTKPIETGVAAQRFTDVPADAWYASAVNKLASGGLVAGIGNSKFDPDATMTYSQFCQVLARAKGGETGTQDGYWAYKAINYCLGNSYLYGKGTISAENYEVPITREIAIAAMFRAKQTDLTTPVNNMKITDIPDYEDIDLGIRDFVLKAYQYGLTTGVDANHTFKPKDQLTRAQVCQLFYNLNWVSPEG